MILSKLTVALALHSMESAYCHGLSVRISDLMAVTKLATVFDLYGDEKTAAAAGAANE